MVGFAGEMISQFLLAIVFFVVAVTLGKEADVKNARRKVFSAWLVFFVAAFFMLAAVALIGDMLFRIFGGTA